jgi:hypothetical protein
MFLSAAFKTDLRFNAVAAAALSLSPAVTRIWSTLFEFAFKK